MRRLTLPLLVLLAGVAFSGTLFGPAGAPIDWSDYITHVDSMSTNSPFTILDGYDSGDHDIYLNFTEDNGAGDVHSFWFDDGNNRWKTDEIIESTVLFVSNNVVMDGLNNRIYGGTTFQIEANAVGDGTLIIGDAADNDTLDLSNCVTKGLATLSIGITTYDTTSTLGAGTMFILDTAAGQDTLNLPAAASHTDRTVIIKAVNANGGHIDGNAGETIDGAAVVDLAQWAYRKLISDGTNWLVIGQE